MKSLSPDEKILSIDIGGSRIKGTILDVDGKMLREYVRIKTPTTASPESVMDAIVELTKNFEPYSKVSVGFPGYVRNGIVFTAPNLSTPLWNGVDLKNRLSAILKQPVRILNDADMQGLGIASGKGLEMVVTLGTGFGTALLIDGNLLPHLEIAHHPVSKERDYDEYVGEKAFQEVGSERWNKRMKKVIEIMKTVVNYDRLYISGGNSKKITFKIDDNIKLVSNIDGIKGGAKLWQKENYYNV
ncbi:MAG: ROK family protein [Cyclobacteriaceae bacterium]|nr:ROK family protein [Cyclobacteriaceae bacterium]